jgi:succinate dehydrogenase / fumarate reductase membrane anchor subunit
MSYRSPLGRARGLGSAREGTAHWWAQRLTAVALVPLTLWFVIGLIGTIGADHALVADWIGLPINATLMVILLVALFHHAQLGLQVVIEDYVHHEGLKIAGIMLVKFLAVLLGLASIFAVLDISFGG